jgi:hypothetical protein
MDQRSDAGEPSSTQDPGGNEGFVLSNPVRSFVGTVRAVLLEPTSFFRRRPPRGSRRSPLVFALVCFLISLAFVILNVSRNPLAEDV